MEYSIVVPAFNEQRRLRPTLEEMISYGRARPWDFEIIVVDDGSTDATAQLVRQMMSTTAELRIISLPANQGKGYAVRAGVLNSRGQFILFADADGSTPIREIERFERYLRDGTDVVIGSRALRDRDARVDAKLYRRLIGRIFHALVRALAVKGFKDTQCGFKIMRARAAYDLFSRMRMSGFSFDVELLSVAVKLGYVVREVAVNWTHMPGSQVNLAVDSLKMARDLFLIRSHLIRGDYDRPHVAVPVARLLERSDMVSALPHTNASA